MTVKLREGIYWSDGVERDIAARAAVDLEWMEDRLEKQAVRSGEDRGDHIDDLGDVCHLHHLGMTDEGIKMHHHH